MKTLLVMVPIRGRRELAERMLESFIETTDNADLVFIMDSDDLETYEGMDWGPAATKVMETRQPIGPKFNSVAIEAAEKYDALMGCGDDHVFRTPHWDTIMLDVLERHGGTGWIWPDDKRRHDIAEIILYSSDLVRTLGWFSSPTQAHYYADNIITELGRRAGLMWYCPDVVIEHLHYAVDRTAVRDETYSYAEETWGASDLEAFLNWLDNVMPSQVALLRRTFNKDLEWLFSKV